MSARPTVDERLASVEVWQRRIESFMAVVAVAAEHTLPSASEVEGSGLATIDCPIDPAEQVAVSRIEAMTAEVVALAQITRDLAGRLNQLWRDSNVICAGPDGLDRDRWVRLGFEDLDELTAFTFDVDSGFGDRSYDEQAVVERYGLAEPMSEVYLDDVAELLLPVARESLGEVPELTVVIGEIPQPKAGPLPSVTTRFGDGSLVILIDATLVPSAQREERARAELAAFIESTLGAHDGRT
jgi:hypothetical protein